MAKVIIIGPAYPLRGGGITTYNHRLAKEFMAMGHECIICSFKLQYPSILFPGTTQYSNEAPPENLRIYSKINSINPLNWVKIGIQLKKERPDIIVVRYWLPFMGPALGTILRQVKRNGHTKIICIADNIIPHEKRPGDRLFTQYFIKPVDGFVTMSEKVFEDLKTFDQTKPAVVVQHPLYDNFGSLLPKEKAKKHLGIPAPTKVILFFGFIRKYKGLDLLLKALALIAPEMPDLKLLVAGEFYEEEKYYRKLINELRIEDRLILKTNFIPDEEVKYYLCAADVVLQPYKTATQSGVTPLAYYFEKPMIVTNVGGLAYLVPEGKCGLVAAPDPQAIAAAIRQFYKLGEKHFIPHLRTEKQKYGWANVVNAITNLPV